MATLYITEYSTAIMVNGHALPIPLEVEGTTQTVAIGGASAASSAFAPNTTLVRLHTDAICSVLFGAAPTATAAKRRMAAGQTEYFAVPLSSTLKVAVITNS